MPSRQADRVSLVPLQDLVTIFAHGPLTAAVQIVGNLLVLAALGFFAPMRFAALASAPRILALAAACSILIETLQYVLGLGRVSSVDDVLLNTAGARLAALASRHGWRDASARGVVRSGKPYSTEVQQPAEPNRPLCDRHNPFDLVDPRSTRVVATSSASRPPYWATRRRRRTSARPSSTCSGTAGTGTHERLRLVGGSLTAGPSADGWRVNAEVPA